VFHSSIAEIAVGYNSRDLDNLILLRIQTGHFEIDPDQVAIIHRG
jgi:hypothetical protein